MHKQSGPVQEFKDKAERQAEYFREQGFQVSRRQSIEGLARAIHGKPWNVVQAQLAASTSSHKPAQASGNRSYYLSYIDSAGNQKPLDVLGELHHRSGIMGVNLNSTVQAASDELIHGKWIERGNEVWWPALYDLIVQHRGALFAGGTPQNTYLTISQGRSDVLSMWIKAFRPHLLWEYIAHACFESVELARRESCSVDQDVDQPGQWTYQYFGEGGDISYPSRQEAELALCHCFETAKARGETGDHAEPWAGLDDVRAGSGKAEQIEPMPSPVKVPGRLAEQTGETLFLPKGPLSIKKLQHITNGGKFPLDVAIPVDVWEMASNELDWLNHHASSEITGSETGLRDIEFERAPSNHELPEVAKSLIWLRVTALWVGA